MKTIPLIQANLKGFMRNKKAIFLLVVFPLILISAVFLSFNPEGLERIPVGIIGSSEKFNVKEYEDTYLSYLKIKEFNSIGDCLNQLKIYNQYVCIDINYGTAITLEVYYDNTQEPVIWEIIERIKSTIDLLQKAKSKEMASEFLTRFGSAMDKIEDFKIKLIDVHGEIDDYTEEIDKSADKLSDAKKELTEQIASMDSDINEVKQIKSNLKTQKDSFYSSSTSYLSQAEGNLNFLGIIDPGIWSNVNSLRNDLNTYNSNADSYFSNADSKILAYESATSRGKEYINEIGSGISRLQGIKNDLIFYKSELEDADDEISGIQKDFKQIDVMDPETLVSPIVVRNMPVYIPSVKINLTEKDIIKGFNLISLQTIFPTILLLISLFLSLLISNFICITDINSDANQRVRMIKGIFFPEMLSIYFSSLIIMVLPIFCVLLLGNYLFRIEIFANFGTTALILFLLSSIFILLGMGLAYLIKKESITLLVTTFILVFLIFISGFLLPIERMSWFASYFARIFPTKIALSAFGKAVFYSQPTSLIINDILSLLGWFIGFAAAVSIIKRIRR